MGLSHLGQVDTYCAVPHGRLKLREITPPSGQPSAELIAYSRPDVPGPRWSRYRRVPVATSEAMALKAALAETVGTLVVVEKDRVIGVHGRTRVHLDVVAGLGAFVELETVVDGGTETGVDAELAETAALLGLDRTARDVIAGSYADLLLAARESPRAAGQDGEESG